MEYHDGATLHYTKVVGVLWGTGTDLPQVDVPQPPAPNVLSFMGNVVQSSYMDMISEYSASHSGIDETIGRM